MENYLEGKYYLVLPVDGEEVITACDSRKQAEHLFTTHYESGRPCHWKGLWDGGAFVDKRPPVYLKGNFYFRILTDEYPIPITRKTRSEAVKTYHMYRELSGACRWLGQWDGERFIQTEEPD